MNTITKTFIKGIAVGLVASFIKTLAEPPLQKIGEKQFAPNDDDLKLRGADVTHQPENMPPAVLAKEVYNKITHKELSYAKTLQSMKIIHYTLGTLISVSYVTLVNKSNFFKAGEGIAAAAAVWALTHGSTVPSLKLQGKVSEMPKSWWVWEFGSHIIFGIAMEQTSKVVNKLF
ncbi:DUF1440 domain-containing protein [Chryseobacterium cheonjiense]|uniref:DUF1440 domain-containing protein n=1 Tax=Chryseobacterium cheonjiense TaxID=2728845 RepID=A0A7Y0A5C0_9FLAO|nr:DUF1440 domain-containing protein [Chryseobacterium cheonjiense]NML56885.1 DUF1440 domain-containing protein [Chryseobacterium cheonjiense]